MNQYVFHPTKYDTKYPKAWIKGSLYEYTGDKASLIDKNYKLDKDSKRGVIFSCICQFIAEGNSLDDVLRSNEWCPSVYLFHLWISSNNSFKMMYHQARLIRSKQLVEQLYKAIQYSPEHKNLDEKLLSESISVLKQMSAILSKEVDDAEKNIVNIAVIPYETDINTV